VDALYKQQFDLVMCLSCPQPTWSASTASNQTLR